MPLFASGSEDVVRRAVLRAKETERQALKEEFTFALNYLNNRQVDDVEQQLMQRFAASQLGATGQEIYPVTIPLTERYVAEAANLYSGAVTRWFTDPDGKETDATREQTLKLSRALERARYDEVMHANERVVVLLKTSCVWYQMHRGRLRPVIAYPHKVYPVTHESPVGVDPADPDDYYGFIVETDWAVDDVAKAAGAVYSLITPEEVVQYKGSNPREVDEVLAVFKNPFTWEQTFQGPDYSVFVRDAPGRMLTFWHASLVTDELILHCDADIARANRELNVLWSILADTIRFQSYSTPVKKLTNPSAPSARQKHGARFPVVLDLTESFEYAQANAPYTETVDVLDHFGKLLAIAKRQNPEDFSVEGSKALTGFSKLVSSLPKMEARQDRARRNKHLEEEVAAPRIREILIRTGELDEVTRQMKLHVRFGDIRFPETSDEESTRISTHIKYNLTTPAKLLAEKKGIALEEAEEEVKANAEKNKELRAMGGMGAEELGQQGQGPIPPSEQRYSSLIARRRAERSNERHDPRQDRQAGGADSQGD